MVLCSSTLKADDPPTGTDFTWATYTVGTKEYYYPKFTDTVATNTSTQMESQGRVKLLNNARNGRWSIVEAKYVTLPVGSTAQPLTFNCQVGNAIPVPGNADLQEFLLTAEPVETTILGQFTPIGKDLTVWFTLKIKEARTNEIRNITVGSSQIKAKENDRPK